MSKRRGRKRNGRPANAQAKRRQTTRAGQGRTQTGITNEAMKRRAKEAGVKFEDARDARCGTAIGRLLLQQRITAVEYEAGLSFARLWHAYAKLSESPRPTARATSLPYRTDNEPAPLSGWERTLAEMRWDESDEERWPRIRDAYADAVDLLKGQDAGALVFACVYGICVEDYLPHQFIERPMAVAALRRGLAAIARSHRVHVAEAA